MPAQPGATDTEIAEVLDALASDARTRIAYVRDGLRSILTLLLNAPGTVVVVDNAAAGRQEDEVAALSRTRPTLVTQSRTAVMTKREPAEKPVRAARSKGGRG